ncbi:MAG: outer membrane beta-barrel protein [Bacteriovoracales bacterium]|nr:outer membrane beta-barrel protein [Bacteriovoracales bacterium]
MNLSTKNTLSITLSLASFMMFFCPFYAKAYDQTPCDLAWWEEVTTPELEELIEEQGKESFLNARCGEEGESYLRLLSRENWDWEVIKTVIEAGLPEGQTLESSSEDEIQMALSAFGIETEEIEIEIEVEVDEERPMRKASGKTSKRKGWYIGVGAGVNKSLSTGTGGSNLDTFCYPDNACFEQSPPPSVPGYRWGYDLEVDSSTGLELFVGKMMGNIRLEGAIGKKESGVTQIFEGITYLDETPILSRNGGTVQTHSQASIGELKATTLMLNTYYDFPEWKKLTPYIGAGIGVSFVKLDDYNFDIYYSDSTDTLYDPPLSSYGAAQDQDFSESPLSLQFHLGVDYRLGKTTSLGIKATFSDIDDSSDDATYRHHPMHKAEPNFTNRRYLDGIQRWSGTVIIKHLIKGKDKR